VVGAIAVLGFVAACTGIETGPVIENMQPASKFTHPIGTTVTIKDRGETVTWQKTGNTTQGSVWTASDGCQYTQTNDNVFAPATNIDNCSGTSVNQRITSKSGSLFPLKVGNSASWQFTQDSGDRKSQMFQQCEVVDAVNVAVPAGEYDTFKVICQKDNSANTYYYAPAIHGVVALIRNSNKSSGRSLATMLKPPEQEADPE
jgi:hypothetical protein